MRLLHKLILFMLASSIAPISIVGLALLRNAEDELKRRIALQQAAVARSAAELIGRDVTDLVESLARASEPLAFDTMTARERTGALSLLYQQSSTIAAVILLNRTGKELVPAVFQGAGAPGLGDHPPMSKQELSEFRKAVPLEALRDHPVGAAGLSPAYLRPSRGCAAAALLVAVPGGTSPDLVAFELSLCQAETRAAEASRQGAGEIFLIDDNGRFIAGPPGLGLLTVASLEDQAFIKSPAPSGRLRTGSETYVAATAPVAGGLNWHVLIRVPESVAFASVARMRRTVLATLSVALLLLLVLGYLFTRRVDAALNAVMAGSQAYAMGDLSVRVQVRGSDELAELGTTFNAMGEELQQARSRLERWNDELQKKVEERTAELKAAQAQLVEAQKLAAVGQLGAGVAHEINNPLAGILGHAQLLLLDRKEGDPDLGALRTIEAAARRARDITHNLLRFSQQRHEASLKPVDLNTVVNDSMTMASEQIRGDGIELQLTLAPALPRIRGDSAQLCQVLLHLLANSRTALAGRDPRHIEIKTESSDGKVVLSVIDTGKGIRPEHLGRVFEPFFTTKDNWTNVGLGLSVSYRIVVEHGGRIRVQSEVGKGARFEVELPIDVSSGPS
jgi:two-component system, NtrC family, sensor kinase